MTGEIDISVIAEINGDYGQAKLRLRFDAGNARDSIHLVFDRKSYLLLNFLRRQSFCFRIDFNLHRRHVRKRVHVQAAQRQNSTGNDKHRNDGYQQSLTIKERNQVVGHDQIAVARVLLLGFALLKQQIVSFHYDLVTRIQTIDDFH